MDKKLVKMSLFLAGGEALYILLVATILRAAEKFLSDRPDNFLSPVIFLLLFVISAAVSGALIIGKPALLYLEGKKKEALMLFMLTLSWLFLILLFTITVSIFI